MVLYRHGRSTGAYRSMSLFLDIGQGAGLAGSSGVRPYLPPLLAGALARGNVGLDFSGTNYAFLESPWWLALMFLLAVVSYLLERRRPGAGTSRQVEIVLGILGLVFGALLFAGSLADNHYTSWPGLIGGVACAALGFAAVVGLLRLGPHRLRGPHLARARGPRDPHSADLVRRARRLRRSPDRRAAGERSEVRRSPHSPLVA
jgi:hypothetical protein